MRCLPLYYIYIDFDGEKKKQIPTLFSNNANQSQEKEMKLTFMSVYYVLYITNSVL